MSHRILATALLLFGFSAGSTLAAEISGSATAGSSKAAACSACHGVNGNSTMPEWPVIAGQNANYLRDQVVRIKTGKRSAPLMMPMVENLSEQDIADLGAFYSTQTPTGNEADPSFWKAGQKLYRNGDAARGIPACASCHGPVGRGNPAAGYPALQAQHAEYTIKQLDGYANGTRYAKDAGKSQASANAAIMATVATRLTAEERRNLASYIQGLR